MTGPSESGRAPTLPAVSDIQLVVERKRPRSDRVVAVELRALDGADLPAWTPGSHIDLVTPAGHLRQYSLCGNPQDRQSWRIGVLRCDNGRGGSASIHDDLREGDHVMARGPRNNFELLPAERYLFIAGGIGITPLLPMLRAVHDRGAEWRLVYGGRQRSGMAFVDELQTYGDRVQIQPEDECGPLDLRGLLGAASSSTMVYCCGPSSMLDAAVERCADRPPGTLQMERFSTVEARDPVAGSFDVVLDRTRRTVHVTADQSVLEALQGAGVDPLFSCAMGLCGTCETAVVAGTPDHRDSVLTAEQRETNQRMMICVSRSKTSRLVLDM